MKNLKILGINENTLNMYKKCFDENGSPKKKENIKWQFLQNTESKSFVDIAFDEAMNKTAAIYATSCVKFKIGNDSYVGSQSLDTITDVDYRGKGLFVNLAKSVYEKAKNDNVSLVYGFPNGNSIHGFDKKLEWQVLDPVPFLLKPLKTKYFTKKIKFLSFLPNFNLSFSNFRNDENLIIKECKSFPDQVNLIWKQFSLGIKVAVERDKAYLDWRYIKKPNENYRIAHCYSRENEYFGFIVYTIKEKHNGKIAYIMEMLYDLNKKEVGKQLLKYAINKIKEENADCILTWCLEHSPNYCVYKKASFFNLPERFRPIELHFGVRTFMEKLREVVNERSNWYISYSDSDTV
ncbi:hypothetical protein C3B47_06330 [Flavobacterium columnare]|uniref:GNAT family N-acetyltransferase n=1 Tax=Flavobacterium columnare TaxID=996 RepID=UPI000D1AAEDB|nr:GNAT family N-acetyltransferase [Flavobacterium columnare]MBF6652510.1 hypothetical protein [Flavobacterium columnare]MBF6655524.1 hypothetical protein [Flavobacterium columnare]MBF6658379.1 hypothetical protein [Flavobacterium columnare]MEB3802202.1 GNAT family N-acetyltransferase [Flavobacterium columnare]PTD14819.1 hypothetical protein C6N29_10405 [Flavobacterium columnare]